jgi:hypothetical protein
MKKMNIKEIDNWPTSWKITSKDNQYGKKLKTLMKPFIVELSDTYSPRTVKMHTGNLWLLGGYTIERINRNEKYRNTEPCLFLTTFIDSWDGPMIRDRIHIIPRSTGSLQKAGSR